MKTGAAQGRAYVTYTGPDGNTRLRYTQIFHAGMIPGTGIFEDMVKHMFDVQDEEDFGFKMLRFNNKHFHYPNFQIYDKSFYEFFGYELEDEETLPLGSLSDNNLDTAKEIEISFTTTQAFDTEVSMLMNFSNKNLYVHESQSWIERLPAYGEMHEDYFTLNKYASRLAVCYNHQTLIGKRAELTMFNNFKEAKTKEVLWGCNTHWNIV